MGTPNAQDLFSRFLINTYDERRVIGVSTGFQAFFGNPAANGSLTLYSPDSNQVDIDIIRGNERIAALVPRGNVGRIIGSAQKNLRSEKFSEIARKFPLIEEEGDVTAENLLNRVAGENPYERKTRITRLRYHAAKIRDEMTRRIIRTNEVLAAESILTGKMSAILGTTDANLQYDFRRTSTHTATVNTSWAGGSGTIMADIEAACLKCRVNGKTTPDMMILGTTAMTSFIKDTSVANLADNRRFTFIQVGTDNRPLPPKFQRFVDGGMIYQGTLRTPSGYELYMFTYLEVYTASNGTATPYLAADKVVICNSQARCDRYFGPGELMPDLPSRVQLYREYFGFEPGPMAPPKTMAAGGVIAPESFYFDAYVSGDNKRITIRAQQAPIFATTQTDAFVVLDTEP